MGTARRTALKQAVRTANAVLAVETAHGCLDRFKRASATSREAFLTLLLFQPR